MEAENRIPFYCGWDVGSWSHSMQMYFAGKAHIYIIPVDNLDFLLFGHLRVEIKKKNTLKVEKIAYFL